MFVALAFLASCSEEQITSEQMAGQYLATKPGAIDIMTLKNDGTFVEVIQHKNGKRVVVEGSWRVLDGKSIDFDGSLALSDYRADGDLNAIERTGANLPINKRFGRLESFGVDEFAVWVKVFNN